RSSLIVHRFGIVNRRHDYWYNASRIGTGYFPSALTMRRTKERQGNAILHPPSSILHPPRIARALLVLLAGLLLSSTALRPLAELFVSGLTQPRGMVFDRQGNLFVAEAGLLDPQAADQLPIITNHTSRVVRITPGRQVSTVVDGLPFIHDAGLHTDIGA